MENTPDNWVVVKVGKNLYKVLAGWSGGYLDGDRWKLNSGISEVKDDGILKQILELDGTELMDEKTDWMKLV